EPEKSWSGWRCRPELVLLDLSPTAAIGSSAEEEEAGRGGPSPVQSEAPLTQSARRVEGCAGCESGINPNSQRTTGMDLPALSIHSVRTRMRPSQKRTGLVKNASTNTVCLNRFSSLAFLTVDQHLLERNHGENRTHSRGGVCPV